MLNRVFPIALVFGVTGQDGSYLTELLLAKGYTVYGVARRTSLPTDARLAHIKRDNFVLIEGDVTDFGSVIRLLRKYEPDEIYNLAAQSHVGTSFEEPTHTTNVVYNGCLNILEAIRLCRGLTPDRMRFYQASSSEMFGKSLGTLYGSPNPADLEAFKKGLAGNAHYKQDENTPMLPCSPYAIAKLAAHNLVRVYRESYGLHASSGILFNHESERRGETFVTRKITKYVAGLYDYLDNPMNSWSDEPYPKLYLGNIDAKRDWGHAADYVNAMWLMLQQPKADDYVVATGETHTVRDFLNVAFKCIGVDWSHYVNANSPEFVRPNDVQYLCGNPSKAMQKLGWKPEISFEQLVARMVDHDIAQAKKLQRPTVC